MKVIHLSKKTGFKSNDKVRILDHNKRTFYSFDFTTKPAGKFNLPAGVFYLEMGNIEVLEKPVKYRLKKLPKPEYFFRSDPKNFKLIVRDNPNKCTIDYTGKTIVLDTQYLHKGRIITDFIFAHERGHRFFKTEKFADRYAKNYLFKAGYNPSQLLLSPELTLSNRVLNRKENLLKY